MPSTLSSHHSPQAEKVAVTPAAAHTRQLLTTAELKALSQQSNALGLRQLIGHFGILGISGYWWLAPWPSIGLRLPALVVYGFSLAATFAIVHECVHRTAFASNRLNDGVGWMAGCLSFYNSTFFRKYHKWHHRYTRIPGKDPELTDLQPTNWWKYALQISGLPWWRDKVLGLGKLALGQAQNYPFLSPGAHREVIRSARLHLGVYAIALILPALLGHPAFFLWSWLLPMTIGQPILRFILLAEHTLCTFDDDPLNNTRTTLTLWPIRFLMWNMPFHAEHHLYVSIPFHQLPEAHKRLKAHLAHVDSGYVRVNRDIIETLQ
jgi:fatty acid desaturase